MHDIRLAKRFVQEHIETIDFLANLILISFFLILILNKILISYINKILNKIGKKTIKILFSCPDLISYNMKQVVSGKPYIAW